MRALIQRVRFAQVEVDLHKIAEIGNGILIFLGICEEDTTEDVDWLASKVVQMRIFADDNQKMNLSVLETKGEIMVISQFTLLASTKKGNRPGFTSAAKGQKAIELYQAFVERAEKMTGKKVETGEFGADMKVHLMNDGPVTIWIDSRNKE